MLATRSVLVMTNRAVVAASAIVLVTLLAGCATEPSVAPVPSSPASAAPTAAPAAAPETRFDLTCDDITTTETVAEFISEPIEKQDALAVYAQQSQELPRLTYIEAMGGLVCNWSNGLASFSERGVVGTDAGVTVLILPEADEQYAKYEATYGSDAPCGASTLTCEFDKLIDGYWVSVSMTSVVFDDAASDEAPPLVSAFFSSVETQVAALAAPAARWTPPAGTVELGTECESIITASEAQAALEMSGDVQLSVPHGGWSIWAAATDESGGGSGGCSWSNPDSEYSDGALKWLPAGAWAAEKMLPKTTYPTAVSSVSVANLAEDDEAFVRCADDESYCVVDLIIGGNWIQATGFASPDSALSAQERAIALAAAVAANVYS